MKNNKLAVVAFVLVATMLTVMCAAYSRDLNVAFTGTNYDPTVDSCVVTGATHSPTGGTTTAVTVTITATDKNGVADFNNTLAKVDLDDALTFSALYESATGTSCTPANTDTDTRTYACTVNMQYWYSATNYSARCSVGDVNDSTLVTGDHANAFAYASLAASTADGTAISFGTITDTLFSTAVADTNSPIILTNTGNIVLATVSITGANATATGASNLDVGQFVVDDDSEIAGAQTLTAIAQQITGVSVPIEDSTPGGNTDSAWVWFNVPAVVESGSYTSVWTLTEAA